MTALLTLAAFALAVLAARALDYFERNGTDPVVARVVADPGDDEAVRR